MVLFTFNTASHFEHFLRLKIFQSQGFICLYYGVNRVLLNLCKLTSIRKTLKVILCSTKNPSSHSS